MGKWEFTKGLHDLGNGCWAYLLPDGSWGWNNAGLIADGDTSMVVDTLFDLKLTGEMLAEMAAAVPAAKKIDILVNSHADGDHTFGNQLFKGARIIGTQGTVDDFDRFDPAALHKICQNPEAFGSAGVFVAECMRPFDFSGIELTPPNEIFSGTLDVMVGNKKVQLIEVGPSHSLGDALVYVPEDKVLYAADILFTGGTPIAWYGPVKRWIDVCDMVLDMDVEIIVPGHGPISTKDDMRTMRDYLVYITEQARPLYDAGVDYMEAAYKIDLGQYRDWDDAERVVVTLRTLYDDFEDAPIRPERAPIPFFTEMKAFRHHLGRGPVHEEWYKTHGHGH